MNRTQIFICTRFQAFAWTEFCFAHCVCYLFFRKNGNGEQSVIRNSHCTVKIDGEVRCVVSTSYTTVCISDYTNFPYDEHNCTVRFGSWTHTGEELNLEIDVITEDLVPNGEWKLINTSAYKHPGVYECCPNNTYPSVDLSFKIQRLSGSHTASVVFSAIGEIIIRLFNFCPIIYFSFDYYNSNIFMACSR